MNYDYRASKTRDFSKEDQEDVHSLAKHLANGLGGSLAFASGMTGEEVRAWLDALSALVALELGKDPAGDSEHSLSVAVVLSNLGFLDPFVDETFKQAAQDQGSDEVRFRPGFLRAILKNLEEAAASTVGKEFACIRLSKDAHLFQGLVWAGAEGILSEDAEVSGSYGMRLADLRNLVESAPETE